MKQTSVVHGKTGDTSLRSYNTNVLNNSNDISHIANSDNNKTCIEMSAKLPTISEMSNWIVTIVQACSTTLVGLYVVLVCASKEGKNDIIYGCRCRLVDIYLWVLWSYFVSDILRLHKIHEIKNCNVTRRNNASFITQGKHIAGLNLLLARFYFTAPF